MPLSRLSVLILVAATLVSCGHDAVSVGETAGDTLHLRYAEKLTMTQCEDYTVVSIVDPWHDGAVLHTYVLVDRADSARVTSLPEGTVVYTPLRRAVVSTSPHCNLLLWLGAGESVAGVCDADYLAIPYYTERLVDGTITPCGSAMSPDVEHLIELDADAILLSPFENATYGGVGKTAIPIVECADYMETSALGRAEWMRFYGRLFDKDDAADSLFTVVESSYFRTKQLADSCGAGLSLLTERKTGAVWYCPGGHSSLGQLFKDAHAGYAFGSDEHSGSLALSPEKVIADAADSDVWMFIYNGAQPPTRRDLLAEYHGYAALRAFRTGDVYGCSASESTYFDEISFRPDLLLREITLLSHPQLMVSDTLSLRYYRHLHL